MKNSNALMGASIVWSFMNFALKVPAELVLDPFLSTDQPHKVSVTLQNLAFHKAYLSDSSPRHRSSPHGIRLRLFFNSRLIKHVLENISLYKRYDEKSYSMTNRISMPL